MVNTPNLPAAWQESEQLDGLALVDKASLVGTPFRITGFYFSENDKSIGYVYVDGEDVDGNTFTFNDSSTGVRAQIIAYLQTKGDDSAVSSGEYVNVSLVIPNGLRVSEFVINDERGRPKNARTFYLTTSGKRAAAEEKTEPKTRTRARS